jgi:hypothetical protein
MSLLGRDLVVFNHASDPPEIRRLAGNQIPPAHACVFWAREPFTVLGINTTESAKTTPGLAQDRFAAWQDHSQRFGMPDSLRQSLDRAQNILTRDSIHYKAFARRFLQYVSVEPKREVLEFLLLRILLTQHVHSYEKNASANGKIDAREFAAKMLCASLIDIVRSLGVRGGLHVLGGLRGYWGTWKSVIEVAAGTGGWRREYSNHNTFRKAYLSISDAFTTGIDIALEIAHSYWDLKLIQAWECHRDSPLPQRSIRQSVKEAKAAMNAHAEDVISVMAEHLVNAFSGFVAPESGDGQCVTGDYLAYIEANAESIPGVLVPAAALSQMPILLSDGSATSSLPPSTKP